MNGAAPREGMNRVLLLHSTPGAVNRLRKAFLGTGLCEFETTTDPAELVNRAAIRRPDLVLVEYTRDNRLRLFIQKFRNRKEWAQVPVLVYAAEVNERNQTGILALNPDGMLTADVNQDEARRRLVALSPKAAQAESREKQERLNRIRSRFLGTDRVSPLPTMVRKILQLSADPNSTARQIAALIEQDAALTSMVLKTVNSAYYGFYRRVENVPHAIVILGFNEIKDITLSTCLMRNLGFEDDEELSQRDFWLHAIGTAHIARALNSRAKLMEPDTAFAMGLLHDIGKVVLMQHERELFLQAVHEARAMKRPLREMEREVIGIDHAEVGALVATGWNLPERLELAIGSHLDPEAARESKDVLLVHTANHICHWRKIGRDGEQDLGGLHEGALEQLGFGEKSIEQVWPLLRIDEGDLDTFLDKTFQ